MSKAPCEIPIVAIKKKQDQIEPLRILVQQLEDDDYFPRNSTAEAFILGENLEDDLSQYFARKQILYPHQHSDLQLNIPFDEHFPLGDGNLPRALDSAKMQILNLLLEEHNSSSSHSSNPADDVNDNANDNDDNMIQKNESHYSKQDASFEGIVIHICVELVFMGKDQKERRDIFNLRGKIKGMSKACDAGDIFALDQSKEIKL